MPKVLPNRRSIRLQTHDYTLPGAYFVTFNAYHRKCLFGEIINGTMNLNPLGRIVENVWHELPQHYPSVALDAFVVMPDHIHGIIILSDTIVRARLNRAPADIIENRTLGQIVHSMKSFSTRKINALRQTPGNPVWQRNYHDRIIPHGIAMDRIRRYIHDNPMRWETKYGSHRPDGRDSIAPSD